MVKPGAVFSVAPEVELIVTYRIGTFGVVACVVRDDDCELRPTLCSAANDAGADVEAVAATEPLPPGNVMIPVYEPVCGSVAADEFEPRVAAPGLGTLTAGVDEEFPPLHAATASATRAHPTNGSRFTFLAPATGR
jgi:hypothetical protein